MRTYDQWMTEYGKDHQHPTNRLVHLFCVPLIMFSVIGLLWSLPTPMMPLNWGMLVIALALTFYLLLKFWVFAVMLVVSMVMSALCLWLQRLDILLPVSSIIFLLAWIGQFVGHKIEGRKPSFLTDLAFLLIGPVWVMKELREKLSYSI